jgi:hypothetical protein
MQKDVLQSYNRRYYTIARWFDNSLTELYVSPLEDEHFASGVDAQKCAKLRNEMHGSFSQGTPFFVVLVTNTQQVTEM